MTYQRPGVYIQEVALQQAITPTDFSAACGAFSGTLPQGPVVPTLCGTWRDFVNLYGGLNNSYPTTWAAYHYFSNGGRNLYVNRVPGSGATAGSASFTDGSTTVTATVTAASASGGVVTYTTSTAHGFSVGQTVTITGLSTTAFNLTGVLIGSVPTTTSFTVTNVATGTAVTGASATATVTPGVCFTLSADNVGSWSQNYQVQIVPAGTSNRFGIVVTQNVTVNGNTSTAIVEQFTDLSMNPSDPNYVASIINATSNTLGLVTNVNNAKFPYTGGAAVTLAGGTDGTAPNTAAYKTAWTNFDSVGNSLVLYAADAPYASAASTTAQMHADAISYASTRTDAFAVIDTPAGMGSATAAQNQIVNTVADIGGNYGNLAAAYWPWVYVPDATKAQGTTSLQAPGGMVVGQYIATDILRGPQKTPAGLQNQLANALSTEYQFTNADLNSLNASINPINTIRNVPGAGIVIMGGRTLTNNPGNRYINLRRSLIYIEKQISQLTQFAVFENNDANLWTQLKSVIGGFLLTYWQQGGLRGTTSSQAYYVICDSTINSFTSIQNGYVNIEVGVALEYPAEFVVVKLSQLTGSATA